MIIAAKLRQLPVPAAQEARREGPVGQERKAAVAAQRERALLYVAIEQVVGGLERRQRRQPERPSELQVCGVAQPDRARLPFALQRRELFELRFPRPERLVAPYQVHVIGVKAPPGSRERRGPLARGPRLC